MPACDRNHASRRPGFGPTATSRLLALIALLLAVSGCCVEVARPEKSKFSETGQNSTILQQNGLKLGLIPQLGGRIVHLSLSDSPNLLKSDPSLYRIGREPTLELSSPGPDPLGHTTWVSPQGEWWVHQDLEPGRKARRSLWPPDPVIEFGNGRIVEQNPGKIVIELPVSPYTGVQMTKTVEILDTESDHAAPTVRLSTTISNRRAEPVTWGLWTVTRPARGSQVYAPLPPETRMRFTLQTSTAAAERPWPYQVTDGWIHFDRDARAEKPVTSLAGKIGIDADQRILGCFVQDHLLIKRADPVPSAQVHPTHSGTEIFALRPSGGADDLFEMEFHGPCVKLEPGQSTTFTETWHVLTPPRKISRGSAAEQVRYLKQALGDLELQQDRK